MNGTISTLIVVGVYLACGVGVAIALTIRGHSTGTAATAVVVWPFLLPLLRTVHNVESAGPCGPRIDHTFDSLLHTLQDPASNEVPWANQALELRAALHKADARLAFVDRVLADTPSAESSHAATMRDARKHAADEIDAVLSAVAQLRLQVGLITLAGDALPVQSRLEELMGRANALLEVHEAGYMSASA